jgi:hypothetical protein
MLEDDAMLEHYRRQGASAIDMETGCLFALARRIGLRAAAVHIVSDNAANRDIDPEGKHALSIRTQLQVATAALYKGTFAEDPGVRKGKGERREDGEKNCKLEIANCKLRIET